MMQNELWQRRHKSHGFSDLCEFRCWAGQFFKTSVRSSPVFSSIASLNVLAYSWPSAFVSTVTRQSQYGQSESRSRPVPSHPVRHDGDEKNWTRKDPAARDSYTLQISTAVCMNCACVNVLGATIARTWALARPGRDDELNLCCGSCTVATAITEKASTADTIMIMSRFLFIFSSFSCVLSGPTPGIRHGGFLPPLLMPIVVHYYIVFLFNMFQSYSFEIERYLYI